MDKKYIYQYIKTYAPTYSKEQLTKRLLESGVSYDDIEECFHAYYDDVNTDKVKYEAKISKKKLKKHTSVSLYIVSVLLFATILFFPYQISSIFINDSIKVSNYFEIDQSSFFNQNGTITLYLALLSDLDLHISQYDSKNFIFVDENICSLDSIKSENNEYSNSEFISLTKDILYEFSYSCNDSFSNNYFLNGQITFNLYENSISDYIYIKTGSLRLSKSILESE